jgi:hypothetical protein
MGLSLSSQLFVTNLMSAGMAVHVELFPRECIAFHV